MIDETRTRRRDRLVEQRDELLAALDRLDADLERGVIDEADHAALSDDLTRRTARVIRRLDDVDPAPRSASGGPFSVRNLVVMGIVVVCAVALGFVVASYSGDRGSSGSVTGEIELSSRDLLGRAEIALAQGLVDDAARSVEQALELAPGDPDALVMQGRVFQAKGQALEAIQSFDQALAQEPDNFDALVFQAQILLSAPDAPELQQRGIDLLDAAIALDPVTFEAHMWRGFAAANVENDPQAAIGYYEGVLERNPPEQMRSVVENLIAELEASP